MIDPREAWRRLATHLTPRALEPVARRDARGRVLAQPLIATADVPAADVSAMDGYAVGSGLSAGDVLAVAGTVAAGDPPGARLPARQALRIMTGAPLPQGADRVVPVELTDRGARSVRFAAITEAGEHVRRRGEVAMRGATLLPAGTPLTAGALALAAAHGLDPLPVHGAPRVAVLVTGDEVVPAGSTPGPGQLRDTHTDFLLAAVAALGLDCQPLGIAPDRAEELSAAVRNGLARADVLLMTGGVSAGEFDLVEGALAELGCRALFDSVAIQPGKPLVAMVLERPFDGHPAGGPQLVFGLPGNPGAVMTCFWLFVRPALRCLLGHRDGYFEGFRSAELAAPAPGAKARERFLNAEIEIRDGRLLATPLPPKGSHDLVATARGTALLHVPAHGAPREAGEACSVLEIV